MKNKIFYASKLAEYAAESLGCGYVYGTYGDICTPALRQRKAIQYPAQKFNLLNVSNKWDGRRVFDCAGLIKGYIFGELGVRYSAQYDKGATGMFRDWCKDKNGKWQTLPEDTGTLVFKGQPGGFSHVGIYIGDGQVIEAKSSREGVVQTAFSGGGWHYWGQPYIFDYTKHSVQEEQNSFETPETQPGLLLEIIKYGSRGEIVKYAQTLLQRAGYKLMQYGADGHFGSETEDAVLAFQTSAGLAPDGVIGAKTWDALLAGNTANQQQEQPAQNGARDLFYIPHNMMRGDDVALVQQKLIDLGLFPEHAHGAFNAKTDTAVRRFQKLKMLEINGVVGGIVAAELRQASKAVDA